MSFRGHALASGEKDLPAAKQAVVLIDQTTGSGYLQKEGLAGVLCPIFGIFLVWCRRPMNVPAAPRRRFYRGMAAAVGLCYFLEGMDFITNSKMWFVIGFVPVMLGQEEEEGGMGMKRKDHYRHTAIIIARTTLHNYEFLISSTTGYRHLYISQYQPTSCPPVYLPTSSVPVPSRGLDVRKMRGQEGFQFSPQLFI
jgi:hypothetical protein